MAVFHHSHYRYFPGNVTGTPSRAHAHQIRPVDRCQAERLPTPERPVSAEIVTILAPGEAPLPQRRSGAAQDRAAQLVERLQALTGEGASLVELNFRKSIEARAPTSIKALVVDLDYYTRFSAERSGIGLPADEARLVDYCEARRLKPATVSRRLSSLAVAHHLLDVPSPVRAGVVRDALRGLTLENRLLKKSMMRMGATKDEVPRIREARDHQARRAIAPAGAQDPGATGHPAQDLLPMV